MKQNYYTLLIAILAFICTSTGFAQKNFPLDDTTTECARLRQYQSGQPASAKQYQEVYDSLKKYIEYCANFDEPDHLPWHAFTQLQGANSYRSTDPERFNAFRPWLISVLYLNTTDPYYFCAC